MLLVQTLNRPFSDEQKMYSSARLFGMINVDERLLKPAEEIRIPTATSGPFGKSPADFGYKVPVSEED